MGVLPAGLLEAAYVYVRRDGNRPPLAQLYEGPYAVISRGAKFFKLQVGPKEVTVSIDRMKPHLGAEVLQPAVPARRGRPPNSGASAVASLIPSSSTDSEARGGPCGL